VEDGVATYFKCFHAQPFSLMCQQDSRTAPDSMSLVVLNSMLSLSIRCSSHPFWADRSTLNRWIDGLTEKSWRELLRMYGESNTNLEYLQGLCLLSQVDFAGSCTTTALLSKKANNLRWASKQSTCTDITRCENCSIIWISYKWL
jgi:hypothetical protein